MKPHEFIGYVLIFIAIIWIFPNVGIVADFLNDSYRSEIHQNR